MDKKNTLFLWLDNNDFYPKEIRKRGVATASVYRNIPIWLKAIRRLQINLKIGFIEPWLSVWVNDIKNYKAIIIHASRITAPVVKFIHKRSPSIRIIVWYWNPVEKCEPLDSYPSDICERWCFDENDSIQFSLPYNTQYYFMNSPLHESERKTKTDIYFLGGDKGRLTMLLELESQFKNCGLRTNFHITKTSNNYDPSFKYQDRINYDRNLDNIFESAAILDIVSAGQNGLTIRPLEALCFRKKLITNDASIVGRDFYHPDNIFVIGINDILSINDFISRPYFEIDNEIRLRYDFDLWLDRFQITCNH